MFPIGSHDFAFPKPRGALVSPLLIALFLAAAFFATMWHGYWGTW